MAVEAATPVAVLEADSPEVAIVVESQEAAIVVESSVVGFRGGYYGGGYYGPSLYFGVGGYPDYGAYAYDPYDYGADPYAYGYPAYPAPPAPAPQDYGYSDPSQSAGAPPAPSAQPQSANNASQDENFYLIAFTDHTIEPATAYKVEGDQIHWITREGQEKQAPLSRVDIGFSQQINRDRHVDFQIP